MIIIIVTELGKEKKNGNSVCFLSSASLLMESSASLLMERCLGKWLVYRGSSWLTASHKKSSHSSSVLTTHEAEVSTISHYKNLV